MEPLVHGDACVTFSDGAVDIGKAAVKRAYEVNFSAIEAEDYRTTDVHWIRRGEDVAVYMFAFAWSGRIKGSDAAGAGRGTTVLISHGSGWHLLAEQLAPSQRAVVR